MAKITGMRSPIFGILAAASFAISIGGCASHEILSVQEIGEDCTVQDNFRAFANSRGQALRLLREELIGKDVTAVMFDRAEYDKVSDAEYQALLREREKLQQENPDTIFCWISTGVKLPSEGLSVYKGVVLSCRDT